MLAGKRADWGRSVSWLIKGTAGRRRALLFPSDSGERRPLRSAALTRAVRNTYGYARRRGRTQNDTNTHTHLPADINPQRTLCPGRQEVRAVFSVFYNEPVVCLRYSFAARQLIGRSGFFSLHGEEEVKLVTGLVFAQCRDNCE